MSPGAHHLLAVSGALVWPLLALQGCHPELSVEQHRVRAAVREYNLALPRAYRERDPRGALAAVATEAEISRVWTLVLGLSQQGLVLDSRQEEMADAAISLQGADRARLVSRETWWYQHLRLAGGEVAQAPRRLRYEIAYHLLQQQGQWRVDRLEVVKSTRLEPSP